MNYRSKREHRVRLTVLLSLLFFVSSFLSSAEESFLTEAVDDASLSGDVKRLLQANFDKIFVTCKTSDASWSDPTSYQEFELNRNTVKIGDYYYSGVQLQIPDDRPITEGTFRFLFPSPETSKTARGLIFLGDEGTIQKPERKKVSHRSHPDFRIKHPGIEEFYLSHFRIRKPSHSKRVAIAFRFRSDTPRTIALAYSISPGRADRNPVTMDKIQSIAFDFPLIELDRDSSGKGKIKFVGEGTNFQRIDGFVVSGFTFRAPKNISYGNLVLMLVQPNGTMIPINRTPEAEIKLYNAPSGRPAFPKTGGAIKVAATSWLKQSYANIDTYRKLSLNRFSNRSLRPGEIHSIVIIKKGSESPLTGIAIGFTDSKNEEFSRYLPVHLAYPLVD